MISCPHCAANLKFSIEYQKLACESCNSQFDVNAFEGEGGAEEDNSYEVTVFTCPQCAGELYTTDTSATAFCSFCGASNILESRIERELRPQYIIPFKKSKEDCKKEYMKTMRMAVFAPKELKSKKHIESFRGIYMPYWLYHVKQQDRVSLEGKRERRSGDYIITSHYDLSADLDAQYKGMSCDASSSFADSISEKLAPFDVKEMKHFTPGYLSGFYADTADVPGSLYQQEVKETAARRSFKFIKKNTDFSKYIISHDDSSLASRLKTKLEQEERAMFPVWFLAYRNKDRVAYATVNGQTGKVVADLPVDIGKYIIGTCLLAIPIFVLLNLFFTVTPKVLLGVVAVISMAISILHAVELGAIRKQDAYEDDKGHQHMLLRNKAKAEEEKRRQMMEAAAALGEDLEDLEPHESKSTAKEKSKNAPMPAIVKALIIFFAIFMGLEFIVPAGLVVLSLFSLDAEMIIATGVSLLGTLIAFFSGKSSLKKMGKPQAVTATIWCLIAGVIALIIAFLKPVHDAFYYGAAILAMVSMFVTLIDLIQKYNILATRRLPQFDYKGGDDRA
ncbi:MAG: hypothetical protein IJP29_06120 [Lachnospiraceae bacterium]|nr:hypothetical protein [Lachnospiraceae bacterium]